MLSRRRMLAASGGLLAGAAGTAALVSSTAGRAAAADAELQIDGHDTTIRSGAIDAVWLTATVAWSYALPSGEQPATAIVELQAGDEMQPVATSETDAVFLESSGEATFEVDLVAEGVVSPGEIRPDTGGETIETDVAVGVAFRVVSERGVELATDSGQTTATLSITESDYNASQYGDVAGSGELTVELA